MSERGTSRGSGWAALALALAAGCGDSQPVKGAGSAGPRTGPAPEDPADFGPLPDFRLLDERGEPATLAGLLGRPVVFGALFSTCAGPCPSIARSLKRLQDELADTDVRLVVVTVDPDVDTPEVLAGYARRVGADPARWTFLTGAPAAVKAFVQQGLFMAVERGSDGLTHDVRLLAVDRRGHRRGWYTGTDEQQVERLRRRMLALAAAPAEAR
jgi:cytochrome oxidase Cu insertion factor (SCO1/SenC/PrrC family)